MRSSDSETRRRAGFTLVELLVVIAIIGILVALLLPAIQAAREAGRRMSCSNKLHQIGIALHNYHDVHNKFPPEAIYTGLRHFQGGPAMTASDVRHYTWMCLILPFVEQKPLHDMINFSLPGYNQMVPTTGSGSGSGSGTGLVPLQSILLDQFLCPSDSRFEDLPHGFGYTSYAGNQGWSVYRYQWGDDRIAGMFGVLDSYGLQDVQDGTSNTIFVSEVSVGGYCCRKTGMTQWDAGSGALRYSRERVFRSALIVPQIYRPNHAWVLPPEYSPGPILGANGAALSVDAPGNWNPWRAPYAYYPVYNAHYHPNVEWLGAGSPHPSGILSLLVDASVRFIPDSIQGPANKAAADAHARDGNIWTAAHYPKGIKGSSGDKTMVVWP